MRLPFPQIHQTEPVIIYQSEITKTGGTSLTKVYEGQANVQTEERTSKNKESRSQQQHLTVRISCDPIGDAAAVVVEYMKKKYQIDEINKFRSPDGSISFTRLKGGEAK